MKLKSLYSIFQATGVISEFFVSSGLHYPLRHGHSNFYGTFFYNLYTKLAIIFDCYDERCHRVGYHFEYDIV